MADETKVLHYMPPTQAAHHLADALWAYAVGSGKFLMALLALSICLANAPHLLLCQFGIVAIFTATDALRMQPQPMLVAPAHPLGVHFCTVALASLTHHVMHIIRMSARKEMVRAYAARSVATMANHLFIGEIAIGQMISKAMNQPNTATQMEYPVAVALERAVPQPASIGALYAGPEDFNGVTMTAHSLNLLRRFGGAMPRTVAAVAGLRCVPILPAIAPKFNEGRCAYV